MPQILVEYSPELAESFDRRKFALALHPVVGEVVDSPVAQFKTRFQRLDELVVADGAEGVAIVHVRVAVLSGRDAATRKAVSDAVGAVLAEHLTVPDGFVVQATVEIADLDRPSYGKQILGSSG